MTTTAIATLSQVSTALNNNNVKISKKAQRQIADYIARGGEITTADATLLDEWFNDNRTQQIRTVSEVIYALLPEGTYSEKMVLGRRINGLLRNTAFGRTLTTTGRVALTPKGAGSRATWYGHIIGATSVAVAEALVPVRTAASQRPRVAFPRSIADTVKEPARVSLKTWMEVAGIGRRWRTPAVIAATQGLVRTGISDANTINTLSLQITQAAQPIIVDLVNDAVRQIVNRAPAAVETETAH